MTSRDQQGVFEEALWDYYHDHGRQDLPWRQPELDGGYDPYKIMVSELMLQQTQVSRVVPKYAEFLDRFPDVHTLAQATLGEVLQAWQGLGYNRRAKFLWQTSQIVDKLKYFPNTREELIQLPGIGKNTAGAILAYAFNQPTVFIETNVRTVYIHHFFHDQTAITDKQIIELLSRTFDPENPREFYWALMDYGSYLKTTMGNLNKKSRHYVKQSTFHGSRRQIRGQVIRVLGGGSYSGEELVQLIADERLLSVLEDLVKEALITEKNGVYSL